MKRLTGIVELNLLVNGERRGVYARPSDTLLRVLREKLGLTGAKAGCENGDCGACTVLFDGLPVKSCLLLAVEAEGHSVTTAEGLKDTPVQRAFLDFNGFQCGYCTAGFLLNAHSLIAAHPEPDDEADREWLESNLCRCTGYEGIRKALSAARTLAAEDKG